MVIVIGDTLFLYTVKTAGRVPQKGTIFKSAGH